MKENNELTRDGIAIDHAMEVDCDEGREIAVYTTDGRWSVSYDELYYRFGEAVTDTNENGKLLEEELRQREEINALIMTEDAIEMTYHLEHCPNCQQGGIAGALNLVSLMGCNIYDEHDDEPAAELMEKEQPQMLSM